MPEPTVGRLSLYRRLLSRLVENGKEYIYSHELAALARSTPVQVRRDLMMLGYPATPTRGYGIEGLVGAIGEFLDAPGGQRIALVGVGDLGRAVLAFFANRRPTQTIVAAFDVDERKVGRVIAGCRCHHLDELPEAVKREGIRVGVIAVPADEAQRVADLLIASGVGGLVNFAPARLLVPAGTPVEDVDITLSLERIACLTRWREG